MPTAILIKIVDEDGNQQSFRFSQSFTIGREESCDVRISSPGVSREHVKIVNEENNWQLTDLNTTNGTYLDGQRIERIKIAESLTVRLGIEGPVITFTPESDDREQNHTGLKDTIKQGEWASKTHYINHYFSENSNTPTGGHTRMIQSAYQHVRKKQKRFYISVISVIVVITVGISIYAVLQYLKIGRQQQLAQEIFYSMKDMELELAQFQRNATVSGDTEALRKIDQYHSRHKNLTKNYDRFLQELHIYDDADISEQDRIIFRVARIFGECELAMPKNFLNEVKKYIKKWQSSDRLEKAVGRARKNDYPKKVTNLMLQYNLPPQFFYLALQESDYIKTRVGPKTRYGYAKGIWQFIPRTAVKYGLRTGPLVELPRYDPRDERFNFNKAAQAAALYISDIYSTEAQASGLLVIASYNWGEHNIRDLIRNLPENPRERNFWQVLKNYRKKIPNETYSYVFYIFSAAVIGENPELFGFNFKNPLS